MAMLESVKLSLSTFQPDKCYPPYLNTPRSLEACRINGINPVELVEVPYGEFQRDFPNDADAARRRYERIDGARRRIFELVKKDWQRLVDEKWVPPEQKPKRNTETILDVAPQVHCKLLELQAKKFRKIEEDNWNALQRNLKLEIRKAEQELENQKILETHDNIAEELARKDRERILHLQLLEHDHIMAMARRKEEEEQEIKRLQKEFGDKANEEHERRKQEAKRAKQMREKKELERIEHGQYTQQMKDAIMRNIETRVQNRQKSIEIRNANTEKRMNEFFRSKSKEREDRRAEEEEKIKHAQEERRKRDELARKEMLDRITESERHRKQIEDNREAQRQQFLKSNDQASFERMMQIKEKTNNMIKEKADKTLSTLNYRDDIAKQEMEKIHNAQEKRRRIKQIRQEAHEIAAIRAKKAEEYRLQKIQQDLQAKDDRFKAIKKGFNVLEYMRNSMKDIMNKTNTELKHEMERLRHTGDFSPSKVVDRALEVSNQVLFPRLEKKFGIQDPNEKEPYEKMFGNSDGFNFNFGDTTGNGANAFLTGSLGGSDTNAPSKDESHRQTKSRAQARTKSPTGPVQPREEVATLNIHILTQDKLKNALLESMKEVEKHRQSSSPGGTRSASPGRRGKSRDTDSPAEDYDDENGPILQLLQNDDGTFEKPTTTQSSPQMRTQTRGGKRTVATANAKLGGGRGKSSSANDVQLPMFPFTAGQEYAEQPEDDNPPESAKIERGRSRLSKSMPNLRNLKKKEDLRTDVNDKAHFLPTPKGKFRREFSLDHPYAPKGLGKYEKELKKGLRPVIMDLKPDGSANDVEATLKLAEKVQKLTYDARTETVQDMNGLDNMKKELNKLLNDIIEEERVAEEDRQHAIQNITDPIEKQRLEAIFSEERSRASDRIIGATKEHDAMIKKAMLKTLNLGNAIKE